MNSTVTIGTPIPESPHLGTVREDGAIWTTCGWQRAGPAWVRENQIAPTVGYGWEQTGATAEFQGQTLFELIRAHAATQTREV